MILIKYDYRKGKKIQTVKTLMASKGLRGGKKDWEIMLHDGIMVPLDTYKT